MYMAMQLNNSHIDICWAYFQLEYSPMEKKKQKGKKIVIKKSCITNYVWQVKYSFIKKNEKAVP